MTNRNDCHMEDSVKRAIVLAVVGIAIGSFALGVGAALILHQYPVF